MIKVSRKKTYTIIFTDFHKFYFINYQITIAFFTCQLITIFFPQNFYDYQYIATVHMGRSKGKTSFSAFGQQ